MAEAHRASGAQARVEALEAQLLSNPDDANLRLKCVYALVEAERFADAEAHLGRLDSQAPGRPEVELARGTILARRQRYAEALAAVERAIASGLDSAHAHSVHGSILQHLENFAAAEAPLRRALALEPDVAAHIDRLAWNLDRLNRSEEGRALRAEAMPRIWNQGTRAEVGERIGRLCLDPAAPTPAEAKELETRLAAEPENAYFRLRAIQVQFSGIMTRMGTGSPASETVFVDHARWLICRRPDLPNLGWTLNFAATTLESAGDALATSWEEALSAHPDDVHVHENAAAFLEDGERAQALYERLSQLQPDEPHWPQARAALLLDVVTSDARARREAVLSARPFLERAEELDRAATCAAPLRRRALGYACLKAGDLAAAKRWMQSALATRTGKNELGEAYRRHGEHTLLGLIALAEGDRARAVEELARSVAVFRGHAKGIVDFHNELAGALFDAGEREVVSDYLREAGVLAPEHRQEEFIAGAAVVQSGRKPRAWAFGDHAFVGLGLARRG